MSFLFALGLLATPIAAMLLGRRMVARREDAQVKLLTTHAHLQPKQAWRVAYSSAAHMESLFKLWSWEDVGVLHLYDEALTFFGEAASFEIDRDLLVAVRITTYMRTNPLVPWIELETSGGVHHYFCVPEGFHVLGMRSRCEEIHAAIDAWSRGSARRPLQIG